MLVDYESLPSAAWERIAPHFAQPVDAAARARMQEAAAMDSKAPVGRPARFAADAAVKRAAASGELRRAIDALARPRYDALRRRHS
jgi:hypothetical protein